MNLQINARAVLIKKKYIVKLAINLTKYFYLNIELLTIQNNL